MHAPQPHSPRRHIPLDPATPCRSPKRDLGGHRCHTPKPQRESWAHVTSASSPEGTGGGHACLTPAVAMTAFTPRPRCVLKNPARSATATGEPLRTARGVDLAVIPQRGTVCLARISCQPSPGAPPAGVAPPAREYWVQSTHPLLHQHAVRQRRQLHPPRKRASAAPSHTAPATR